MNSEIVLKRLDGQIPSLETYLRRGYTVLTNALSNKAKETSSMCLPPTRAMDRTQVLARVRQLLYH